MLTKVWNACHASVCQLGFLNERGVSIDYLSGFKVNKSLVTSQHAFYIEKAHKVQITFVDRDASTPTASIRIPYAEFIQELRIGVINNNGHYAVINIDLPDFENIPSLEMSELRNFNIGSEVAVLAFNGGCSNLCLRKGIISSAYTNSKGVRFLQLDGQTCFGNSGAPLIDPITNEVLGIVSRRNSPLSKAYNNLIEVISSNMETLQKVKNVINFADVDPIQVLIANQQQIKHLASTVYMHSSTSITDVVMLDRVLSFFKQRVEVEHKNESFLPEEAEYYIG